MYSEFKGIQDLMAVVRKLTECKVSGTSFSFFFSNHMTLHQNKFRIFPPQLPNQQKSYCTTLHVLFSDCHKPMQNNTTTKHSPTSMNLFIVYESWELDIVIHQRFQKLESKDMKMFQKLESKDMKMEIMHKVSKTNMLEYLKNKLRKTGNMCNVSP
jgi:hypothetical protein